MPASHRPDRQNAPAWWQTEVIYQIYPRSFQDSNGDGIGDLAGIESRLDEIVALGVGAIWISPFFPSPMADFGYDVSDYCGVDPMFGTLADFDSLLAAAHARGLKVILDFVPCHSSDQHPWFVESRASRSSSKRDWYIWRDARPDGSPPTNWIGEFGGSAWTWDDTTGQYYLSVFLSEQPALNWANPDLRTAMLDAMRFWLDRGVDGFRVDAIIFAAPDVDGGDHPPNPDWTPAMGPARSQLQTRLAHQPGVFDVVRDMRRVTDSYPDRVLIGETSGTLNDVMPYYGADMDLFHLPFYFAMLSTPWQADALSALVARYEAALPDGAWPTLVLGNHDISRIASRAGVAQARVALTLLLTLRGTPVLYQGDEMGMDNATIPHNRVQDPWERRVPGLGLGRDPARTPMPWTDIDHGGFSTTEPWLPLHLPPEGSFARQATDPGSMLNYARRLIALRRAHSALSQGTYRQIHVGPDVMVFERRAGTNRLVVCLNMSATAQGVSASGVPVLSSCGNRVEAFVRKLVLAPNEAVILDVSPGG
ncbi:alpha-amylase [Meridianimarinicoccus roseus]|uniref:Alpha-amylase n=2 Tax=Meridianimarinicoccus roseus TaxID=2072018 RepID=A0A2V2LC03_9RHOB|nr:alpha-amylase [Meridianimarinicoccus roseus]